MNDEIDPIELSEKLIAFESVSPARGEIFDYLESVLTELGFACTRLPFVDADDEASLVDNLYAEYVFGTANDAPHLAFCGHLDVVPAGDEAAWRSPPFAPERRDGKLYGRGSTDMKSAIACFVASCAQILRDNPPKQGQISLLITGDEEDRAVNGMAKMMAWLSQEWQAGRRKKIDLCITGEPTSVQTVGDMAKIGRRGSMNCRLHVLGAQGHVAYPERSANAAHAMVQVLERLRTAEWDKGNELFPPSHLQITSIDINNPTSNISPGKACARFNMRFNDEQSGASLVQKITDIVTDIIPHQLENLQEAQTGSYPDYAWHLEIFSQAESFACLPNQWHEKIARAVEAVTGKKPEWSTAGGVSDSRFIAPLCTVLDFGLCNHTMHQIDEHVPLDAITELSAIYQSVIREVVN